MTELATTVAPTNSAVSKMQTLSSGVGIFSTFTAESVEEKKKIFAAISDAMDIRDHLNEPIALANVVAQAVSIADTNTGEVIDTVRVILVSSDGDAYAAISDGLLGSLRDLFGILGEPATWSEPVPIIVKEEMSNKSRRFFKIVLA
jgi:hypothetical protein